MYTSAKPYFYGTGRRKSSVARVRLYPGSGKITINNRDVDEYFGLQTLKLIINQPFGVTNTAGKYDIVANVNGGVEVKRRADDKSKTVVAPVAAAAAAVRAALG